MICPSMMGEFSPSTRTFPELPQVVSPDQVGIKERIELHRRAYSFLETPYQARGGWRMGGYVLLATIVALAVLGSTGHLATFPQDVLKWVHQVNWIPVGIGAGVAGVLSIGAIGVIFHVRKNVVDPITERGIEKLHGNDHWKPACYSREDRPDVLFWGHLDMSTLDEAKSGIAFFYGGKPEVAHYGASSAAVVWSLPHAVGAIAYNTIRLFVIPFYILVQMGRGKDFTLTDIPKEWGRSLVRIVKAPLFATAMIFSAIYSFVDPLNGRKLGSYVEREWNEQVTRAEGFWSVGGPQELFAFEGGGEPGKLGRIGFYSHGCWQPMGVVTFENGEATSMTSLAKAVDPTQGKDYSLLIFENFDSQEETLRTELLRSTNPWVHGTVDVG